MTELTKAFASLKTWKKSFHYSLKYSIANAKSACVIGCVDRQNRPQKVFKQRGFPFEQSGLALQKLTTTPMIYTVSSFNILGFETLFGELSSPHPIVTELLMLQKPSLMNFGKKIDTFVYINIILQEAIYCTLDAPKSRLEEPPTSGVEVESSGGPSALLKVLI